MERDFPVVLKFRNFKTTSCGIPKISENPSMNTVPFDSLPWFFEIFGTAQYHLVPSLARSANLEKQCFNTV